MYTQDIIMRFFDVQIILILMGWLLSAAFVSPPVRLFVPSRVECSPVKEWDITSIALDTSSRKPIILLDVDGVLNRFNEPYSSAEEPCWPDEKMTTVRGFCIKYSPTLITKLNTLSRLGQAEVRWLTAWNENAPLKLAPALGIDDFKLARGADGPSKGPAAMAIALACPERPIVWLDDELDCYAGKDMAFWKARSKTLLIQPHYHLAAR